MPFDGDATTNLTSAVAMVVGLFPDRENAERAYRTLSERGYDQESVNLVITDETRKLQFPGSFAVSQPGSRVVENTRGTMNGLAGSLTAADVAPASSEPCIVCTGPIAATIAGSCVRGAGQGLTGALVGSGISEDRAAECENAVNNGGILLSVRPRSVADAEHFEREWKAYSAESVCR